MARKADRPVLARERFAVISDPHVGNHGKWGGPQVDGQNARCRVTLDALARAVQAAADARADHLFVAGDLFHSRRPEPAVIAGVQRVLRVARALGVEVVLVPGNHDMLDADAGGGNTACEPLSDVAKVVRAPLFVLVGEVAILLVPFTSRRPMAEYLAETVPALTRGAAKGQRFSLVTHVGVWDEADAPPWMRSAKDGISSRALFEIMGEAGVESAFVGNYHEHRTWELRRNRLADVIRLIVQVGTLCPGSFGDAGLVDRGLVVLSDGGQAFEKVEVPGPRFVVAVGDGAADVGARRASDTFYVRQVGGRELAASAVPGNFGGYEWVPEAAPAVPGAASEATAASDPRAALAAYVEEMDLPAGADRAAVGELVSDLWRKAT